MSVRCLTPDDVNAYAEFRLRMWPVHKTAGWESVRLKYDYNPLAMLCPGSGLYAYFQGQKIFGTMGAYPTPITLDGSIHAGHMLVDWAILPEHQYGPTFGELWNTCLSLPGRKFSSPGTVASRRILDRLAVRIWSRETFIILQPLNALLLRTLRLVKYASPSSLPLECAQLPRGVQFGLAESFDAPSPYRSARTAFVRRDRSYWSTFCSSRLLNGAIPLKLTTAAGEANIVLRLLDIGPFKCGSLLAFQLKPATIENSRRSGLLLRATLSALGLAFIDLNDIDELTQELARSLSRLTRCSESYWYGIRRPSDTFHIEDVNWWLTRADRDAIWGVD